HCTSPAYPLRDHTGQRGIYLFFKTYLVYDEFSTVHGNALAEVCSVPFRVYSAKKFPGMTGVKTTKDAYCIFAFQ
ncbi:22913_t:CDS:2, partial [Racocetra persica]